MKKEFYHQKVDSAYTRPREECKKNMMINNRLFNLPQDNTNVFSTQTPRVGFEKIRFVQCRSNSRLNTNSLQANIFSLPEGKRLDKKCIKNELLTKGSSCIPFVKDIIKAGIKGIEILNMGSVFYRHGNLYPENMFLKSTNEGNILFLDNMLFDNTVYDNPDKMPFREDFNIFADSMVNVITGTSKNILPDKVDSVFDVYNTIKAYLRDNFDISVDVLELGVDPMLANASGKLLTRSEVEYKLRTSVFDFIYKLKCIGATEQFIGINEALRHEFVSEGTTTVKWDSQVSDF